MCFLIEETKGLFPLWLAPTQVKIMPITDNQKEYANKLLQKLIKQGVRAVLDDRNEKIGYKIREAQLEKVPYMAVLGAKEVEEEKVAIRSRKDGDLGQMNIDEFISKIKEEIENKVK